MSWQQSLFCLILSITCLDFWNAAFPKKILSLLLNPMVWTFLVHVKFLQKFSPRAAFFSKGVSKEESTLNISCLLCLLSHSLHEIHVRLTRIQKLMVIVVTCWWYFSFLLMSFKVLVEPVLSIPSCNRISVDPLSANDWEILVSCSRQHPEATWQLWTLMILFITFKEV